MKYYDPFQKLVFSFRRGVASALLTYMRMRNSIVGRTDKRNRFYAEYFTDRKIRENFFPDFSFRGCMVEVGCATPELLSMSQHFRETGWRCIGIEPNPHFAKLHKDRGNEVYEYAAADFESDNCDFTIAEISSEYSDSRLSAHSYSSLNIKQEYLDYKNGGIRYFNQKKIKVHVRQLDHILESHCPEVLSIDLVAIDVEGYEIEVMKGFNPKKYKTKVIVLENLFHNNLYTEYMKSIGYRLHSKVKYNYIYVPINR